MKLKTLLAILIMVFSLPSQAWYFQVNNQTDSLLAFVESGHKKLTNVEKLFIVRPGQTSKKFYVGLFGGDKGKLVYSVYANSKLLGNIVYEEKRNPNPLNPKTTPSGYVESTKMNTEVKVEKYRVVIFTIKEIK